jgi:hypothetical protein
MVGNDLYCQECATFIKEDVQKRVRIILDAMHMSMVNESKEYRLRRIKQVLIDAEVLAQYEEDGFYFCDGYIRNNLIDSIKDYQKQIEDGAGIVKSQNLRVRLMPQIKAISRTGHNKFQWITINDDACEKCKTRHKKSFSLEELRLEMHEEDFCTTGECNIYLLPG